ncbi:hypothetical protein P7H15_26180 [Paenibacillus larvae]|nr:hypothetical protein [Paenibacillus larvae]MDT2295608.1 hypothetical protein [Paenibacillus larvae]
MNIEITDVVIVAVIVGIVEMAKGSTAGSSSSCSVRYPGYCGRRCLLSR